MRKNDQWPAITCLAVLILCVIWSRYLLRNVAPENPSLPPVIADIRGRVSDPGVHLLSASSARVADALEAAGGMDAPDARLDDERTLSRPVHTGDLIRVTEGRHGRCKVEIDRMEAAERLTLGMKLDLTTVSEEELKLIPQMKPDIAAAIVERRKRAPWRSVDELTAIAGVGPKTVQKWKEWLEVSDPAATP